MSTDIEVVGADAEIEWRGPGAEAPGRTYALTRPEHRRLAEILQRAQTTRRPMPALTSQFPELNESDAAQIRDLVVVRRVEAGDPVVAAKVSIPPPQTADDSRAVILGWITASMHLPGPDVDLSGLIGPRWHAAVALRLAAPLRRVDSLDELLALVDQVLPCLEVVDSRQEPGPHSAIDAIADNAAAALLVTAPGRGRSSFDVDGLTVSCAAGPGDEWTHSPREEVHRALAASVALANRVVEERRDLGIGGLLISAPVSPTRALHADRLVRANFGSLGSLRLRTVAS